MIFFFTITVMWRHVNSIYSISSGWSRITSLRGRGQGLIIGGGGGMILLLFSASFFLIFSPTIKFSSKKKTVRKSATVCEFDFLEEYSRELIQKNAMGVEKIINIHNFLYIVYGLRSFHDNEYCISLARMQKTTKHWETHVPTFFRYRT